jgi:hypothetical protein
VGRGLRYPLSPMDLLLPVLALTLAVWLGRGAVRAVGRLRRRRAWARTPGATPDTPLVLRPGVRLADALEAVRCECGGRVRHLGETSRLGLRVARGRCAQCERDVDVYVVLPTLLH